MNSSPKLNADLIAGMESCIRTLSMATPGKEITVLRNVATEFAKYAKAGGLAKPEVVDRLYDAALSNGIVERNGEDAVQNALSVALAEAPVQKQEAMSPKPRLNLIRWSDINKLPRRDFLVRGLLDRNAMSIVYGGSNTGKTFIALDISACVALNREWMGRKVRHGAVVYIAAEGGLGIEERLTAYKQHHEVNPDGIPLYVIPEPIDLCRSDADVSLLLQRLQELPKSPSIELIVVDTLSRTMAGGNENSSDDMGRFVRNCDRIRTETRAHVLIIHHSGKDDTRGARGHSLLKAAADTEVEVSKSESTSAVTATVRKQRDHIGGDVFGFQLKLVEIGCDNEGEPITSCIVTSTVTDTETLSAKASLRLPKATRTALRALYEAISECGSVSPASNHIPADVKIVTLTQWRDYSYRMGVSTSEEDRAKQQAFKRASEKLIESQLVGFWNGEVWITPLASKVANIRTPFKGGVRVRSPNTTEQCS